MDWARPGAKVALRVYLAPRGDAHARTLRSASAPRVRLLASPWSRESLANRACYLQKMGLCGPRNYFNSMRKTSHLRCCLFLFLAVTLLAAPATFAQRQRGQVRLEVTDAQGASVAAQGAIRSEGNQFERTFQVSSEGHAVVSDLPFGVYRLSLEATGFAKWEDVVEVHSEVPVRLAVKLGVATVTTQVQVNDAATLLDPTSTGTLFTVGQKSIDESLQTQPGRSLLQLVGDEPGWIFEGNGVLHPRGSEYEVQFVVDGQPVTQNRSPAFAPAADADEAESMRILTANYPAEYGRKLGGVVEITTEKSLLNGWHGEFVASAGSFNMLDGAAGLSYAHGKDKLTARAWGLHSDRYLDPPVVANLSNLGNSGGFGGTYEHEFANNDRLRLTVSHSNLNYLVPNDLPQAAIGQRQDTSSGETSGDAFFQHSFSPTLFLSLAGGVHDSGFRLNSNDLATPVVARQERGYREGYLRGDIAGHRGHHDWKAGIDSLFTPVHEQFFYHITDLSQFDPGTQPTLNFSARKWDVEPAIYVQDQMRFAKWNISAGLRYDYYSFVVHKSAVSPRIGVSRYIPQWDLLIHASYDRIFQTPAMENLLLASSPQLNSLNPEVLRLPVDPANANFFEAGITKALFGKLRLDANIFRRNFSNYADDDVLLQTGVSFPIAFAHARIFGEEVRLQIPNWGRFSGAISYANQSGVGQGPITGGLFLGSDASGALSNTTRFVVSQDQRNTLHARVRFQAPKRAWLALSAQYGSGLPADVGDAPDIPLLTQQYGAAVVAKVNFDRNRVAPNFSLNFGAGWEPYRREARSLQLQFTAINLTDRLNVVNFASLFSGTAIAPPRSIAGRVRFSF